MCLGAWTRCFLKLYACVSWDGDGTKFKARRPLLGAKGVARCGLRFKRGRFMLTQGPGFACHQCGSQQPAPDAAHGSVQPARWASPTGETVLSSKQTSMENLGMYPDLKKTS